MVRALFTVAECLQPAVIFIDEIDSILSARKAEGATNLLMQRLAALVVSHFLHLRSNCEVGCAGSCARFNLMDCRRARGQSAAEDGDPDTDGRSRRINRRPPHPARRRHKQARGAYPTQYRILVNST